MLLAVSFCTLWCFCLCSLLSLLKGREGKILHLLEGFAHFTYKKIVPELVVLTTVGILGPCGPLSGGPTGPENETVVIVPESL